MTPHEATALAAIRAQYAVEVTYTGAGLAGATVTAIPAEDRAPAFAGAGSTLRTQTFEIDKSELPDRPRNGDTIAGYSGRTWRVNDVGERNDLNAWVLGAEL